MAIRSNAVSFVQLLFEYGASLQRLALIDNFDFFKINVINKNKIKISFYIFIFYLV
jgi:hypothetical protein